MNKEEIFMNKLIFTSHGLTNPIGKRLIRNELKLDGDMKDKKIFVFHEPHEFLREWIIEILCDFGFKKENIIMSGPDINEEDVLNADIYYVTEGNTFEVMDLLRRRGLDRLIKEGFSLGNKIYIGCSAGAAIGGCSIEAILDFDRNFVKMTDFTGLGLLNDGIIIPHYTKEELARYIKNSPGIETKYSKLLSVANSRKLVLYV